MKTFSLKSFQCLPLSTRKIQEGKNFYIILYRKQGLSQENADQSQKEGMIKSSASRAARNMRAMASYQMRINKTAFNFAECGK